MAFHKQQDHISTFIFHASTIATNKQTSLWRVVVAEAAVTCRSCRVYRGMVFCNLQSINLIKRACVRVRDCK